MMVAIAWISTLNSLTKTHASEPGLCDYDLPEAIAAITDQPHFRRARWGIRVETLGDDNQTPRILYDREGDRLFIPASNVKLLTTAAALDRLGAGFRIRTSVYAEDVTPDAVVLRLVGRGDPSLSNEDLTDLAQQVGDRGIHHVSDLIIDDSYFQSDAVNPNWEWEDVQAGYGAPVTSLILNHNELRVVAYPGQVGEPVRLEWLDEVEERQWQIENWTTTVPASGSGVTWVGRDLSRPILYIYGQRAVGAPPDESSISIPDPAEYVSRRFRAALESNGIRVDARRISRVPSQPLGSEIAYTLSPTVGNLLIGANQNSENIYAEALLRQIGIVGASPQPESPLEAGLVTVKNVLARLGIEPESYVIADGSGLSRQNLVSPGTFVEVLQAMARHPEAAMYRESLAVAGTSGTLRSRFRNTAVEGQFYGKTGGLTGIASLSGYFNPPHYEPLVVSVIVSHSNQAGSIRRRAIDDIILRLAQLRFCSL